MNYTPENLGYFSREDFVALSQLAALGNRAPIELEIFTAAFYAYRNRQVISIRYRRSADGIAETFGFEPHRLSLQDGVWYLRGLRHNPQAESGQTALTLALHRITELDILPITFSPEPELEDPRSGIFGWEKIPEVKLLAYDRAINYALEYLPDGEIELADGRLEITLHQADPIRIRNFVLLSGGDVTVVSPDSLKAEICRFARRYLTCQETSDRLPKILPRLFRSLGSRNRKRD